MGLGALPAEDKHFLGMLGMHGTYEANLAMYNCDVMLNIGARFDDRVTGKLSEFSPQSEKIHIDIDASSINKNIQVDVGIIGDAEIVLDELMSEMKAQTFEPNGSALKKYHETGEFDEEEIYPYITEGIGEDIIPANIDFDIIDHFEKVSDKDGAVMTRRLAREEGLLLGYSAGSAMAGLLQLKDRLDDNSMAVLIFHDSGTRYINKVYNDEWMKQNRFI